MPLLADPNIDIRVALSFYCLQPSAKSSSSHAGADKNSSRQSSILAWQVAQIGSDPIDLLESDRYKDDVPVASLGQLQIGADQTIDRVLRLSSSDAACPLQHTFFFLISI